MSQTLFLPQIRIALCITLPMLSLGSRAQFRTIMRQPAVSTGETYEQYSAPATDVADTINAPAEPELTDTLPAFILTEEQRQQLYLQLVYYDNEINERLIELYNLQLARDARRLRGRCRRPDDYETDVDTSVRGVYSESPELTAESVLAEILKAGLHHPRVVLAQAVLETGWFRSSVCRNYNNLFGLTNPRTKEYYRFDRWQDSVRAYYTKVQYKYKGGNYLRWLRELGYAEDPDYTAKLRVLLDGPLRTYAK